MHATRARRPGFGHPSGPHRLRAPCPARRREPDPRPAGPAPRLGHSPGHPLKHPPGETRPARQARDPPPDRSAGPTRRRGGARAGVAASASTRSGRLAPAARSRRARSSILVRLSSPRSRPRSVVEPHPGRPFPGGAKLAGNPGDERDQGIRVQAGRGAGLSAGRPSALSFAPRGAFVAVRRRRGRGLPALGSRIGLGVGFGPSGHRLPPSPAQPPWRSRRAASSTAATIDW